MAEEVGIEITMDDKTSKGFKSASKNADSFGKKMTNLGGIVKGLGGIIVGFVALMAARGLGRWMGESIKLAGIQQQAVADLGATLQQMGTENASAASEELQALAGSLQSVTTFGDEAIIEMQTLGLRLGQTTEQIRRTTEMALDLATVKKVDLKGAMELVTQAAIGETAGLLAVGIRIDQTIPKVDQIEQAMLQLNEQFGGAARAAATTFDGRLTQIGNTFGDLREVIGTVVTNSKLFRAMMVEIDKALAGLGESLKGATADSESLVHDGFELAIDAMKAIAIVTGIVVNAFKGLKLIGQGLMVLLAMGFAGVAKVLELLLKPVELFLDALEAIGVIDYNPLKGALSDVASEALAAADAMADDIVAGAQSMVEVDNMVNKAINSLDAFEAGVKAAASGLKDDLGPAASSATGKVVKLNEAMAETVSLSDQINAALIGMGDGVLDFGAASGDVSDARIKALREEFNELDALAALEQWRADKQAGFDERRRAENLALLEERKAQHEQMIAENEDVVRGAIALGRAMGATFAAIAAGTMTVEEGLRQLASTMVDSMISAIETVMVAEAAKAAAGAASGMFSIPIIGPALAAGAAASAFAFVKGLMTLLPAAAMGGVVSGGIRGVDSVGVLVQHDEGILQRGQTKLIQRLVNRLDQAESGGMQPAGAGAAIGGSTSVIQFNSVYPATSAEAMRAARGAAKQKRRLENFGMA